MKHRCPKCVSIDILNKEVEGSIKRLTHAIGSIRKWEQQIADNKPLFLNEGWILTVKRKNRDKPWIESWCVSIVVLTFSLRCLAVADLLQIGCWSVRLCIETADISKTTQISKDRSNFVWLLHRVSWHRSFEPESMKSFEHVHCSVPAS